MGPGNNLARPTSISSLDAAHRGKAPSTYSARSQQMAGKRVLPEATPQEEETRRAISAAHLSSDASAPSPPSPLYAILPPLSIKTQRIPPACTCLSLHRLPLQSASRPTTQRSSQPQTHLNAETRLQSSNPSTSPSSRLQEKCLRTANPPTSHPRPFQGICHLERTPASTQGQEDGCWIMWRGSERRDGWSISRARQRTRCEGD